MLLLTLDDVEALLRVDVDLDGQEILDKELEREKAERKVHDAAKTQTIDNLNDTVSKLTPLFAEVSTVVGLRTSLP